MKRKGKVRYELTEPPQVVSVVDLGLSDPILLAGSVKNVGVETQGQYYEELNYGSESWDE